MSLHGLLQTLLYSLYVDDFRTSQETCLRTSTVCYGDNVALFYVDDVHTSQEARLRTSTVCYGDSVTFLYVDDVHTSQETHYVPPRPATGIALLSYM
jgi:hypothetical protein